MINMFQAVLKNFRIKYGKNFLQFAHFNFLFLHKFLLERILKSPLQLLDKTQIDNENFKKYLKIIS